MKRLGLKLEAVLGCLRQCGVAFSIGGVVHGFLHTGPASEAVFIGVFGIAIALIGCIDPERLQK